MRKGVKTFYLPDDEVQLNMFLNQECIDIINKIVTPCPKSGIFMYLVEYEDYRESDD